MGDDLKFVLVFLIIVITMLTVLVPIDKNDKIEKYKACMTAKAINNTIVCESK